jgi:hypothetical protein
MEGEAVVLATQHTVVDGSIFPAAVVLCYKERVSSGLLPRVENVVRKTV